MKLRAMWAIGLLVMLSSGCVKYISPVDLSPTGKKYVGTISVRNIELPLPEGEWEVVGSSFYRGRKYVQIILEKDLGNKPDTIIVINRDTLSNSYNGYTPSRALKRTDMLHVVSNNNKKQKAQDGWFINHMRYSAPNEKASDANRQSFKHLIDNKLVMPGNLIYAQHRFTGPNKQSKYLTYKIYFNPETRGFAPPANAEWASSDWNILKINNDPKKLAFIEKKKQEQSIFHEKLHTAFYKK